ncbi:unnamed protein product, partial [Mesorhabditis spiculigera]
MVKRPAVEEWSRSELEDRFHELFRDNQTLQIKNSGLGKQLSEVGARLKRPQSAAGHASTVPYEQYADLEKDRELLQIKLRSLRHQLLTYTHPSARPATASVITGRPMQYTVPGRQSRQSGEPTTNRTQPFRVNETVVAEKGQLIKLNRQNRDLEAQLAEKQLQLETKDKKIEALTAKSEANERRIRELEAQLLSSNTERSVEQSGGTPETQKSSCMNCAELIPLRKELTILKQANERLVAQTLEPNLDANSMEIVDLEKKIVVLEEELKNAKRDYQKDKAGNELLQKLWNDVSSLIGDHSNGNQQEITVTGASLKWERLYAELYDELEKVRNLLLLQHDINQKQGKEVNLLKSDGVRIRDEYEKTLCEMRDALSERNKKITLLESQIRAIAYGNQKVKALLNEEPMTEVGSSNEVALRLTLVQLSPEYVNEDRQDFFFCIEFFDFELQTTNVMRGQRVPLNYTFLYNIVVSKLFVHYIQSDGIHLEMYRPTGGPSYEHVGAAALSLRPLITTRTGKYGGQVKVLSLQTGRPIATINYELNISQDVTKSLQAYTSQETATKMLPIDTTENPEFAHDTLSIVVHRCNGITGVNDSTECAVVYEFCAFSPYFTNFNKVTAGKLTLNDRRDWSMVRGENLVRMLGGSDISLYLVEAEPRKGSDGVLSMLILPLSPLRHGKPIRGTFPMTTPDGKLTGTTIDVDIHWTFVPDFLIRPLEKRKEERPADLVKEETPSLPVSPPRLPAATIVSGTTSSSSSSEEAVPHRQETPPAIPMLDDGPPTPSTSRSSPATVILDGPSAHLQQQEPAELSSPEGSFDPDIDKIMPIPPRRTSTNEPQPIIRSPSTSIESVKGDSVLKPSPPSSTFGQSPPETHEATPRPAAETPSASSRSSLETDQPGRVDEIREMLGNFPPIAKPRLSRPLIPPEEEPIRDTRLKFTDPLHNSIPASDTSDLGSTPRKPGIELREADGKSNLAYREIREPKWREVVDLWLKVRIDSLYVHEDSLLLGKTYEGVNVYVDWCLLDLPIDECRVPNSAPIPRKSTEAANFNFEKTYFFDSRRFHLLSQWLRLGNRLEFNLNTDQGENSDEIAVASVEPSPFSRQDRLTLALYDVNGEHVGDLDVGLEYSDNLIEELRKADPGTPNSDE